jgi:hypothetical protein
MAETSPASSGVGIRGERPAPVPKPASSVFDVIQEDDAAKTYSAVRRRPSLCGGINGKREGSWELGIAFSQKRQIVVFAKTHFPGFMETNFC